MKTILNVGCGRKKLDDQFGIDINPRSNADLICDLNKIPWALEDNTFKEVHCHAVLEHLHNFYGVMEEIWRVSENGTLVYIDVPHHTDTAAYTDPTHVNHLTSFSFDTLTGETQWAFYTEARFEIKLLRVRMLKLYKYLLIEFLINLSIKHKPIRFIRKIWENYFSFIIRGKSIEVVLQVIK
ncbi:MAG: ubiquinone/menaquinone biosynthesis C-methylase UbiE [Gammaproteobacteria bacterium]|jgi:ubiquinone/menaquinone biosynthesis C-methylase UbiE